MITAAVRAHPGARVEGVALLADGTLDVKVRAPALDGRANEAVSSVLAEALGLRPRQVRLVRGERSREKVFEIELADGEELGRLLRDRARGG